MIGGKVSHMSCQTRLIDFQKLSQSSGIFSWVEGCDNFIIAALKLSDWQDEANDENFSSSNRNNFFF